MAHIYLRSAAGYASLHSLDVVVVVVGFDIVRTY